MPTQGKGIGISGGGEGWVGNGIVIVSQGQTCSLRAMNFFGRSSLAVLISCLGWVPQTLMATGDADSSFSPPALPSAVWDVLSLNDGSLIAVGQFASSATLPAAGIVKLNANGSVDSSFAATGGGAGGFGVGAIAQQLDGKLVVGGRFSTFHGVARNCIARLNADGSLDTTFVPTGGPNAVAQSWGMSVNSIAVLPDGKLLVGGDFSSWSGSTRPGLVRLNTDGSLDTTFPSMAALVNFPGGEWVKGVRLQPVPTAPHYAILVAGAFYKISGGVQHSGVIRLKADGTKDTTFDVTNGAATVAGGSNYSLVYEAVPQLDGKVLAVGRFTYFNNQTANYLIRLTSTGANDATFRTNMGSALTSNYYPECGRVFAQPDGGVLTAGRFKTADGVARSYVVRWLSDGSLDTAFVPPTTAANDRALALTTQADGQVLVGFIGTTSGTLNLRRLNGGALGSTGVVQFDSASASVTEDNAVTLTVTRTGGSTGALSVNYQAITGTARSGSDFPATSGTLTWADGDTASKTFNISVPLDNLLESDETFAVNLGAPIAGTRIGSVGSTTITIQDGDTGSSQPTALFSALSSSTTEGTTSVTVTASLSIDSAAEVTVPFTLSGTALVTKDYTVTSGASPLTFAIGETEKDITLTLVDDSVAEVDETFIVTLGVPTGAVLNPALGTHTLTIQDNESKPGFSPGPEHQMAAVGETGVSFTASVTGTPAPTVTWLFNNKLIPGSTGAPGVTLLKAAALTDGGAYAVKGVNKHGTTIATAQLGVVSNAPKTVVVALGGTATLPVTAKGNSLAYAWSNGSGALSGAHYTGLGTKTLIIKGLLAGDTGNYTCRVSNPGTEFVDVPFRLNVVSNKPVFTTALVDLGTKRVSEPVSLDVKTLMNLGTNDDLYPASFSAAKLPAGLKLDPVTGLITGRPLAVSPVAGFAFTLTATNPQGSTFVPAKLVTTALPDGLAGAYTCGVTREATLCPLGGRLDFTVMPNGTLTGNCILGASTHKFSGALDSSSSTPTVATASISVPRTGKSTLTFTFSFDAATGYLTSATLADSAITTPVQGWRNVWNPVPVSTPYAGFYTLAFDPAAAPDPAVPQGNGCAGFTVAANGAITGFSATLADSTAFTLVGNVGPAGEIMLWQSLYAGKGSLQGALDITSGVAPGFTDSTLAGTGIHWTRPSGTGRIYAAGFTDTLLNAVGGRYNAPSAT